MGDADTKYNGTDESIQVNKESAYGGVFYLHAIFKPVFKVEIDTSFTSFFNGEEEPPVFSLTLIKTGSVHNDYMSSLTTASLAYEYGKGTYDIVSSFPEPYDQLKICYLANGTDVTQQVKNTGDHSATFALVTEPTNVKITLYLPKIEVAYSANGGTGSMQNQRFTFNKEQALSANTFTKTGYLFKGWNTAANGSGTDYSDKQEVTFVFTDDTTVSLYAQWEKCTDHNWGNGVCTKCGEGCSHTGGTATCTEQATCTQCGLKYGSPLGHTFVYSAQDNVITENCENNCGHRETATIEQDSEVDTVYTGKAIKALKVDYSDNWRGGKLDLAYSDNVNAGTASGSISVGGATATKTFEIEKANIKENNGEVFLIGGCLVPYDGEPHQLGINRQPPDSVFYYKYGDGDWTLTNPAFTEAGMYIVHYKFVSPNYNDFIGEQSVEITPLPLTVTADTVSKTFGDNDPTFTWKITDGALVSGDQLTDITAARVPGEDVGTYGITLSQAEDANKNYDITFVDGTLTVNTKTVDATVIVNGAPFYYDTTAQEPEVVVKDGDTVIPATEYEVSYSNNTNAGTATVTITDKDGGNYVVNGSATFIINKADPVIGTVGVDGIVKDSTHPSEVNLTRTDTTVDGVLKLADDAMLANKSTYRWVFSPADTGNYNVINGDVQIDVLDTVLPTAAIKVDTNEWKQFINNITFGLFFKETQAVTITAADNENGSGIKEIVYFVSDREYKADELAGVKSVVIDGNDETHVEGQYVINADNAEHTVVVTDNAGNVTEYKVTVYKNYTVTYMADGQTVSSEKVEYDKDATLPAVPKKDGYVGKWNDDGKNIAEDTTISVIYTKIPVVKPDEVKPEDKADLEESKKQLEDMLDDDSYTEDDRKAIQDSIDAIHDALEVIGNVEALEELIGKLPDTIQKDDEAAIKAADDAYSKLTDYERSLVDKDAKKALDEAKAALAELKKLAPATGDNSNMFLWIALLSISGGAIITLTVYDRKRKVAINK